jgi:ribosomal protein L4
VDTDELLVVLLTGGGLALVGTVLGALITQVFSLRLNRETRREARRMAVKSFQRDTLVALQDNVAETVELFRVARNLEKGPEDEYAAARAKYDAEAFRVRMLASRIRDEELRSAVGTYLEGHDEWMQVGGIPHRSMLQKISSSAAEIYDRAGLLIRTLDAIDET